MTNPAVECDGLVRPHRGTDAVLAHLESFLHAKRCDARVHGLPLDAVEAIARLVTAGGKRVRPQLCLLGWLAAGGSSDEDFPVLRIAASLELFHAAALIHDDVMDGSSHRRGRPTVHQAMAVRWARGRPGPTAARLGRNLAVLVGDIALTWSQELVHTAGLPHDRLLHVLRLDGAMRGETMYGQYLDLTSEGLPSADVDGAMRIARYKTAAYTVRGPLQIGAAAAGAPPTLLDALTDYALPLGEAFQFRDDLLGVFGDTAATGKSSLDDLRAAKHTIVLAVALKRAGTRGAAALRRLLTRSGPAGSGFARERADEVLRMLQETGARSEVEELIEGRCRRALQALERMEGLPGPAADELRCFVHRAAVRSS